MTSPVDIRPDQLEIVQDLLLKHLPAGVKVWVFGSRANWTTKDSSDLDLALEGECKLSHKVLGTLKDAFEDSALPYTVDVVDLHRIGDSFRQIVESQRVPLPLHLEEVNHRSAGKPEKDWLYRPQFPEHWSRRSLYSMAQWVNGLAFRNIQFSGTGMPVIKIAEIKNGISGQTKFTEQIFDESVRVNEGDLLFSWSGQPDTSIDASWWRGPEGWLNQHIFRVTPEHNVDEAFFYCLLRYLRPNFVAIARNKQTTGLGHVTKQDLEEIEAALPPLSEQRAIAHVLGTLDDKIELNRRMNETLEAMARALFKSWFVYFEPVRAKMEGRWRRGESLPGLPAEHYDLFPDRLVVSELGEVPEGWQVKELRYCIDVERGLSYKGSGLSSVGVPMHNLNSVYEGGGYKDDGIKYYEGDFQERHVTQPGDVLVANTEQGHDRLLIGFAAVVPKRFGDRGLFSHHLYRVRLKGGAGLSASFVCQLLNTQAMHDTVSGYANGTTVNMLPVDGLKIPPTVIPPVQLVTTYNDIAEAARVRQEQFIEESRSLAAQRDAWLPKLVSGDVRLAIGKPTW